jgi:outer membrane protein
MIYALVRDEFDVRFPEDKRLNGGGTVAGVTRAVDAALADPDVDLVLALDLVATNDLAHRGALKKPAIGAVVTDVAQQGLPYKDGTSASFDNVEGDLRALLDLTDAHRVAILVDALYLEALPQRSIRARALEAVLGIQVDVVPVTDDTDATLAHIPTETEAVYLTQTALPPEAVRRLVDGINARRLPSFSMRGRAEVEMGVMAGMAAERELAQLARRVALHVQRVLLGEDPGTLPVAFAQQRRLVVNMATVRAIDVWPPWQALIGAEQLHAEAEAARVLTLGDTVREAVAANLDVVAASRDVASGAAAVRRALAPLLPQLSANVAGVVIDDDRATVAQGRQAERTLQGGTELTQLLYSDAPLAAYQSERHLHRRRAPPTSPPCAWTWPRGPRPPT